MEVSNYEQAVVQHEVSTWNSQQNASHATDGEGDHEAQGPHDRRGEAQTALVDGEQPVEQLHTGRNGDQHRRQAEEGVDAGAGTHGEEVVQPYGEAQHGDGARCVDHRVVAEQTLAREGGGNFREHTEGRQDQDVDLRVTPRPEQVDVHHRVPTKLVGEDVEVQITVNSQQSECSGQDREGSHDQHVGPGAGPGEDRHVHQLHARCAHLHHGDEEVHAGKRRTQSG
ncbi:hypothetical protein D3C76_967070 [compost metagenome]